MNNILQFLDFVGILLNHQYGRGAVPQGDSDFLDELRSMISRQPAVDALVAVIPRLKKAVVTLMDEVVGTKAAEWGIVNDSMCEADQALAAYPDAKEKT